MCTGGPVFVPFKSKIKIIHSYLYLLRTRVLKPRRMVKEFVFTQQDQIQIGHQNTYEKTSNILL